MAGMTSYGAYDMAGNVREWCWNKSPSGRSLRGGCWYDNTYSFKSPIQAPAIDRSETNGFRCALYIKPDSVPSPAFETVTNLLNPNPEITRLSDATFVQYKSFYDYDKIPLNERVISQDSSSKDWNIEKVQYDAVYNNEKITSYLFLPRNAKSPYQVIIYLPGTAAFHQPSSEHIDSYYEFPIFVDFLVKNGRAVLFPVYNGMFERKNDYSLMFAGPVSSRRNKTHKYTEYLSRYFKDFGRSIDYLETRNDIDSEKIAVYGMSGGAAIGGIFSALDTRIKVNVLVSGGITPGGLQEANVGSFISRINQPTLMIDGEFDSIFGIENIRTMYENIGAKEKSLKLFDSDHIPPRYGMVKETLTWLDKYLGPVK